MKPKNKRIHQVKLEIEKNAKKRRKVNKKKIIKNKQKKKHKKHTRTQKSPAPTIQIHEIKYEREKNTKSKFIRCSVYDSPNANAFVGKHCKMDVHVPT